MAVTVRGSVRLHHEVTGAGEPVLLIPGLGSSGEAWSEIVPTLSRFYRVITMDPRGSGRSTPVVGPCSGEEFAADAAAVLHAVGESAAHVVGKSMGGMIAQEFAILYPTRVRSLALATTYAAASAWSRRAFEVRRLLIERVGLLEQFRLSVMFVFSPRAFRRVPDRVAMLEDAFARNPPDRESYLQQLQFCLDHDTRDRLHLITAPTIVIAGSEDLLTPAAEARELAAGINGAEYREIPGASHGVLWEDPEEFSDILLEFISRQRVVSAQGGEG